MGRININMGDYATGAGIPTGWTARFDTTDVAHEIVEDVTAPYGKYLEIENVSPGGRNLLTLDAADDANTAIALFEFEAGSSCSVYIRGGSTEANPGFYLVELQEGSNNIALWEGNGSGGYTNHDNYSMTLTAGTRYYALIKHFDDGSLRGKVWAETDEEPFEWQLEASDTTLSGGWVGVSELATGNTLQVHDFRVGTSGDDPCIMDDDEFPDERIYFITLEDETVRMMKSDGTEDSVAIRRYDTEEIPTAVQWHEEKRQLYIVEFGNGDIIRTDEYGVKDTDIVTGLTNVFSVSFDYDNNLMYYTARAASSTLYKNSDDGGSQSSIVTGITWASQVFFNADDDLIYVGHENGVTSYDDAGTTDTSYTGITQVHGIAVDDTNVMAGSWNNAGVWYIPIGGGSWTNGDSTYNIWSLDLDGDGVLLGAARSDDLLEEWDTLPPPASANRSTRRAITDVYALSYADATPITVEITSMSPSEGSVGAEVTINGSGFTGATDVLFNGTSVDSFTVVSDTVITTTVPTGATTGDVEVTVDSNAASPYPFVVLPTIPADGWHFQLFQVQVNGAETDIEVVSGTLKEYYTEKLENDFIPISVSNLEETLEWDEGVYRLGSVDVTVQLLEDTYFNSYTSYITAPFVMVIRDAQGNTVFHGPVDPESCRYNAKNRATAFRVLSWDVLLEGTNTPCRSVYETQFSRDYSDAWIAGSNSTVYFKKVLNGVDLDTVVEPGSVLVFDAVAGEYRAIVVSTAVDGDDLEVYIATEPTVYIMQEEVIPAGQHTITRLGGAVEANRLKIEITDPVTYEFLESAPDSQGGTVTDLLLNLQITGESEEYVIDLYKEYVVVADSWYFLDDDRQTFRIYLNVADSVVDDILANGTTISITSQTAIKAGDSVRILGAEMYGYNNSGPLFEVLRDFQLDGGVIQGIFALPELGVLPYIVDTFVFPAGFNKRFTRFGELPPQLLDALRQIQNTFGLFTRLTPRMEGGLPKLTVTVKDRDEANTTDSTVISDIVDILEWSESSADLTPTAVVVEPHIVYFAPSDRDVDYIGFYYDGLSSADPALTGRPSNGRVVTVTVNKQLAFAGDTYFGDGRPVVNDTALSAIAQKFYDYYNSLQRPCEFTIDGTPTEDLLGKVINISITDDPLAGTTFDRTVFVTGVTVNMNTNLTVIRGRIGEFQGIAGQNPVAVVDGQLIWNDQDDSGDETITLSALQSYDPQDDPLTYEWSHSVDGVLSNEPVLQTVLDVGNHTITLTVTDPDSNTDSQVVDVRVTAQSEEIPEEGDPQASFITQSYGINADGDVILSVNGDGNTQTTSGIEVSTATTQVGLDSATPVAYDNPQFNQTIYSNLATGATLWVRVTLINSVDGTDSTNVWEFSVTNTGATSALVIPAGLSAPTGTADATGVDGEIRADASFIYVKINGTGWLRAALASF